MHAARPPQFWRCHEGVTLCGVAESIARFKGFDFGGRWEGRRSGAVFFVPDETLLRADAEALGVRGAQDLFGGIVPHAFVQTKIISHGLVTPGAERPEGWSERFNRRSRASVLPGYSAFGRRDAAEAVRRLLAIGPVRAKLPRAAGAREQFALSSLADVDSLLAAVTDRDLSRDGVVFETNLEPVTTFSVGQVTLDALTIAYHGEQWLGALRLRRLRAHLRPRRLGCAGAPRGRARRAIGHPAGAHLRRGHRGLRPRRLAAQL